MTIGIFVPFLVIEMTSFAVLMAFWQVDGII
jgi:flagellar biosynthesis protein FliP